MPYGRVKIGSAIVITILQGFLTTIGVTSIFPFLALVADPELARNNDVVAFVIGWAGNISDRNLLLAAGTLAVTSLAGSNIVSLLSIYANARLTSGLGYYLKNRLLESVAARDYSYYLDVSPGVVMKKINVDSHVFSNQVFGQLLKIITGITTSAMLGVTLLVLDPKVAFLSALCFAGTYISIFMVLRPIRSRYSKQTLFFTRRSNQIVHQFLSAVKTIKVQHAERPFLNEYNGISSRAAKAHTLNQVISSLPRSLIEPVAMAIAVVIVLVNSNEASGSASFLPMVGVFAVATSRLLPALQISYSAATTLTSNLHAVDEVYAELPSIRSQKHKHDFGDVDRMDFEKSVDFLSVSFSYREGAREVFKDFSSTIRSNEAVAIVGKTGAGKSTFVDLLLGLYSPSAGEISVDGCKLDYKRVRSWQRSIGYVPQEIVLTDSSIAQNIALGVPEGEIDWVKLKEVSKIAQIHDFVESDLEHKWATGVGERGVRLSGGQRQRIGIARALYRSPSVLVLDEATSALDIQTERRVMEEVRSLRSCLTLIIVAHRLSTVEWCDKFIDLDSGSTLTTPPWQDVKA